MLKVIARKNQFKFRVDTRKRYHYDSEFRVSVKQIICLLYINFDYKKKVVYIYRLYSNLKSDYKNRDGRRIYRGQQSNNRIICIRIDLHAYLNN